MPTFSRICSSWPRRRSCACGRAGQVAAHALQRGAHLLELAPQALALGARLLGLALGALALGACLLFARAAGVVELTAQAFDLGAHLVEYPARVGQLALEPGLRLFDVGQPLGGLCGLAARGGGLLARLLELGHCLLERALEALALHGVHRAADHHSAHGLVVLLLGGRGCGRLLERAEGDDRARRQAVLLEVGLAAQRGVDPVDHRAVTLLKLRQGVAARRRDLERLQEAVELQALAHAHGHEGERHLELVSVAAAGHGLQPAAAGRQLVHEAERVHQRAPEHAGAGPAEQLLGGTAPARDGTVTVGEDEAGVDQLAQQLFDCLRGGGPRV